MKKQQKKRHTKNRIIFLRGRKTILRPIRRFTDLECLLVWLNDPEVRQFIQRARPLSEEEELEWLANAHKRENDEVLAVETVRGAFIGIMGLHRINPIDRTAATGAILGKKSYWGRGYGTDAKMALLNHAFNELNLRKIESHVYSYNARSLAYSLHCGYKIEGRKRRHVFKNGRYWDLFVLGLFKKDFMPIWKRYRATGKVR